MKNPTVAVLPNPTLTDTVLFGWVWKADRFTLDANYYHIHFEKLVVD